MELILRTGPHIFQTLGDQFMFGNEEKMTIYYINLIERTYFGIYIISQSCLPNPRSSFPFLLGRYLYPKNTLVKEKKELPFISLNHIG